MSDFYLDLRSAGERGTALAADRLKYFDDIAIHKVEEREFAAVIAGDEDPEVWAPFRSEKMEVTVLLAGRIALEPQDWEAARRVEGTGGLACKAIFHRFVAEGWQSLESLNGNFTAIIYDGRVAGQTSLYIVTDRAGYAPAFRADDAKTPVFSSNTDLLAAAIGKTDDLDITSLGEFVATGRLSFPFTYYRAVKSLDYGAITKIDFRAEGPPAVSTRRYYEFKYTGPEGAGNVEEMASGLAEAFRNSVRRRSLPEMGKSMVSLSGGLDSRTVLSAAPRGTASFSFLDEENYESRIAQRIAAALDSEHAQFKRHPEYYTDVAAVGLRLNAGMGRFIVNTYVGFREKLRAAGLRNLLTGCYCDYFFKGLLVNRVTNRWLRTEQMAPYKKDWYVPFFKFDSPEMPAVTERIEQIVPERLRNKSDNASVFEMEARRVLPLFYETDSRGVAQRVISWSAVTADNDVLDMFRRIPHGMKLNTKVFLEMVRKVCPPEVLQIPDANTGAPVSASEFTRFATKWGRGIGYKIEQAFPKKLATSGSWPDWGYYMTHSKKLHALWFRENALAREVFQKILGYDAMEREPGWWVEKGEWEVILRLITLKIWLDVRIRAQGDPGAS